MADAWTNLPAHLLAGEGWHAADTVLCSLTGAGLAFGIALFVVGRVGRRRDTGS